MTLADVNKVMGDIVHTEEDMPLPSFLDGVPVIPEKGVKEDGNIKRLLEDAAKPSPPAIITPRKMTPDELEEHKKGMEIPPEVIEKHKKDCEAFENSKEVEIPLNLLGLPAYQEDVEEEINMAVEAVRKADKKRKAKK